ncbi:cytochrome P450 [Halomarina ordinaria]|uniref:Cytochrome P450 n=1 Tax=Halomarina ordinaria TaxID=3033939 RepID=A0ABD5U8H7_9EURY|nr:cytochrome P450 [Halomarina sp. PSRA2]
MSSSTPPSLLTFPEALSDPDAWLDPFDWYAARRAEAPVHYDDHRRCWDVLAYEEVKTALGDDETFSVDPREASDYRSTGGEQEFLLETMLFQDPPKHDRSREVVEEFFRPSAVAALEPRIEDLTHDLLDDVEGDRMDVVDALAYPLPVIVIAELLGVPSEDRDRFREWSTTMVASTDGDGEGNGDLQQRQMQAGMELASYFGELIADRREHPRDDLVTRLVESEEEAGFDETELLGFCMLLLIAGNVTTTNLVGNAVRSFAEADHLSGFEPDALGPAVEEVLRYRAPVQAMSRVATVNTTLGGADIAAGDRVVCWLGAANRDGAKFDAPDTFVPDRTPNQHLGFGYGTHYCLGAPLARLEATVALRVLFERFDLLEVETDDLTPVRSSFIYGVESLPARIERRD